MLKVLPSALHISSYGDGGGPFSGELVIEVVNFDSPLRVGMVAENIPFANAATIDEALAQGVEAFVAIADELQGHAHFVLAEARALCELVAETRDEAAS